jgi:integrase
MLMRIRGIKPVTIRKGGRVFRYFYHRATGKRVMAEWGTAGFAAEVERLDALAKERAPRDGSLKALIVTYKKSSEFIELAPRTRADYDKVFDYLKPIGDMPVLEIDAKFLYELRDKAYQKRKRRFANYVVQVVRLLLGWAKDRGELEANPATNIKGIRRPKGMLRANRPWTDEERDVVLKEAPSHLRLMIALGMFGGLREGDACAFPKAGYDGKLVEGVASKNGETLWIPAHFRLREIISEAQRQRKAAFARRARRNKVIHVDPPTLAVTSRGRPWTESGFRASFFALLRRLQKRGLIAPGLTFHGLRHTVGKLIMEAGGSKEMVKSLLGDRSDAMGEWYSREFEKKGLATAVIEKLEQKERARLENQRTQNGKPNSGQK